MGLGPVEYRGSLARIFKENATARCSHDVCYHGHGLYFRVRTTVVMSILRDAHVMQWPSVRARRTSGLTPNIM